MNTKRQIPHQNVRVGILILILIVFAASGIYIAMTGENNNFDANKTRGKYEEKNYNAPCNSNYNKDERYYEDDHNYENNVEQELPITSIDVKNTYNYIKEYTYIPELNDNFMVASLTSEEKMKLVAASLHSIGKELSQPLSSPSITEITIDKKTYKATIPYEKYYTYEVINMYYELFGSSIDMNKNTPMKYGYDVVYKYDELASGYVKYVAETSNSINTSSSSKLKKAIKKGKKLDLYVEIASQTEKYSFEETAVNGAYRFLGRTTMQKNSL